MGYNVLRLAESLLKLSLLPLRWTYVSWGYCPSCGCRSMFLYSHAIHKWFVKTVAGWKLSDRFKAQLIERENYLCGNCGANFRMRSHAEAVLQSLSMSNTLDLVRRLRRDGSFRMYETAAQGVFRNRQITGSGKYIVSEYFDGAEPGSMVQGVRNENLESLNFPDNSFDVVINSDVLEHVGDLPKALGEIQRVLKPGGFHVFTVPVDAELPNTVERARKDGERTVHLLEPVMHGDTIRTTGILSFRDFGGDVLEYFRRMGFPCREQRFSRNSEFVTAVYISQKQ